MTAHTARHAIQDKLAATVNGQLGVSIEATLRSADAWTICGSPADVIKACGWLVSAGLLRLDSIEHDAELDETFAYLSA